MDRPELKGGPAVADDLGIQLATYGIGPNADQRDLEHEGFARIEVSSSGAVLRRLDGFVAWRCKTLTTRFSRSKCLN